MARTRNNGERKVNYRKLVRASWSAPESIGSPQNAGKVTKSAKQTSQRKGCPMRSALTSPSTSSEVPNRMTVLDESAKADEEEMVVSDVSHSDPTPIKVEVDADNCGEQAVGPNAPVDGNVMLREVLVKDESAPTQVPTSEVLPVVDLENEAIAAEPRTSKEISPQPILFQQRDNPTLHVLDAMEEMLPRFGGILQILGAVDRTTSGNPDNLVIFNHLLHGAIQFLLCHVAKSELEHVKQKREHPENL